MTAEQAHRNALGNALRRAELALEPFVAYWELRKQIEPCEMCAMISLGSESRAITGDDMRKAGATLAAIRRLKP